MRAIILAAGNSRRLQPITRSVPKCLLNVGGRSILSRLLHQLEEINITDVHIATGYQHQKILDVLPRSVKPVFYADFAVTNNLYTLHYCQNLLDRPCLILFADLIFSTTALLRAKNLEADFRLMVDTCRNLEGTMRISLTNGKFSDIGQQIDPKVGSGNFVGMLSMSASGATQLSNELRQMIQEGGYEGDYYTKALPRLAARGASIEIASVQSNHWLEVDTVWDLLKAKVKIRAIDRESKLAT